MVAVASPLRTSPPAGQRLLEPPAGRVASESLGQTHRWRSFAVCLHSVVKYRCWHVPLLFRNAEEAQGGRMAEIEVGGIPLSHRKGLWFAEVESPAFGVLEAVMDPSKEAPGEAPDPVQLEALRRFVKDLDKNLYKLRGRLLVPFLFRPVRLVPNSRGRVGVQFRNILTGDKQKIVTE